MTPQQILARVDRSGGALACWPWAGPANAKGYGVAAQKRDGHRSSVGPHQVAYEAAMGPIPPGLHLDHLCRNHRCCNPAHLEAVTRRENILRGVSFSAINAAKTHCLRGHPFSGENLRVRTKGYRGCRECGRLRRKGAVL